MGEQGKIRLQWAGYTLTVVAIAFAVGSLVALVVNHRRTAERMVRIEAIVEARELTRHMHQCDPAPIYTTQGELQGSRVR